MIPSSDFFLKLNYLHKKKVSFVAFRFPGSTTLECYNGKELKVKNHTIPKVSGFIMMPFEKNNVGYFISNKKKFSTKMPQKSFKKNLLEVKKKQKQFNSNKKEYLRKVLKIKDLISKTELAKLVYSTNFELDLIENNFDVCFTKLLSSHKRAFCYLFYIPKEGIWMGASPESLLEIQDRKVSTMALAGTKKKGIGTWGTKEIEEQKIVKDEIKKNLNPYCKNIKITEPSTMTAGKIDHLKTTISGITNNSPAEIINAIHPTPAVGGSPREKALSIIKREESYNRSFYSGYLGKINDLNCKLFVNLRCAHFKKNKAKIFVGGGITEDSEAEKEWEEIINKSQTILEALCD